jgi:hypothetical protein
MPSNFAPTEEQRRRVTLWAGLGMKQEQIARLVGLHSTATLRKHFRAELLQGPVKAAMRVRKTLYQMATSGRNQAATMFWLKTRAGWSEKGREPETLSEQDKPQPLVVRFIEPRYCEETDTMLPPLEPDESKLRYWRIGENGEKIPVAKPPSRRARRSQRSEAAPPKYCYEDLEP